MYKALLVLLLLLAPGALNAKDVFCGIGNRCITSGEELQFKVFYNVSAIWVAAGEASFTTTLKKLDGKPVFHIVGLGNTYKSYDWIFRVRDRYETFIDTETLMPRQFIRHVDEGGYTFSNFVTFDHTRSKAYSNKKIFDVPDCVQDVLSAIYYARNINYNNYKIGDKIPFSMFLDDNVYQLYIRYHGKFRVKTKYGTFNAIKITPLLIKGTIFKGGEDMVVWVSDDENHIPVRVESPILVGTVKVDMMAFKNLKYPLTSLIGKK